MLDAETICSLFCRDKTPKSAAIAADIKRFNLSKAHGGLSCGSSYLVALSTVLVNLLFDSTRPTRQRFEMDKDKPSWRADVAPCGTSSLAPSRAVVARPGPSDGAALGARQRVGAIRLDTPVKLKIGTWKIGNKTREGQRALLLASSIKLCPPSKKILADFPQQACQVEWRGVSQEKKKQKSSSYLLDVRISRQTAPFQPQLPQTDPEPVLVLLASVPLIHVVVQSRPHEHRKCRQFLHQAEAVH